jgi:hypothetical protein
MAVRFVDLLEEIKECSDPDLLNDWAGKHALYVEFYNRDAEKYRAESLKFKAYSYDGYIDTCMQNVRYHTRLGSACLQRIVELTLLSDPNDNT